VARPRVSVQTSVIEGCIAAYEQERHNIEIFTRGVRAFFEDHPGLRVGHPPIVHSVKSRMKAVEHLRDKLRRQTIEGRVVSAKTFFRRITDLGGVRVIHLYQEQFREIQQAIERRRESGDWTFAEAPRAYTWDPESAAFFQALGLRTQLKPTFYTSIHYVVRPRPRSPIACEIQVRTLFEEIWGEIDHALNYPRPTSNAACAEQLRVLSKLAGAGTRLADAIFRTVGARQAISSRARTRARI
jgi:putative GTP pyrophosphokinase